MSDTGIRESEEDRQNERRVAIKVADKFKCETNPTETLCPYDFTCIRDNKRVALLEVRNRECMSDTFDGLFMSKDKHDKLTTLSKGYGNIPVIFVISFNDGDFWLDLMKLDDLEGGFGSRGKNPAGGSRATDEEPVWLLPNKSFKCF
jgi:hypothetical protein